MAARMKANGGWSTPRMPAISGLPDENFDHDEFAKGNSGRSRSSRAASVVLVDGGAAGVAGMLFFLLK